MTDQKSFLSVNPTLADSLNTILPALSTELATPTSLSYLQKLAKLSVPIPRAGFEIRLNKQNSQVDLQQGIFLPRKRTQNFS
ncbi:hypothetical protein [Nostoc sp. 'Peltigera malacea cyanobiont' DB3992]|uniref:hypothetical protein n=1 Tax=Nostoc sp. 'Peltigera malacea cyanobiont' DB3992 TaxID=1206980 RepID=UPI00117BE77A|nr:hypothetical protein [Nostoc sp. 'Peltigera malacea cyanobiont' DB3992]